MTRVIFYLEVVGQDAFLAKFLRSKVIDAGRSALLYGDSERIRRLDESLWTARDFLPHCLIDSAAAVDTPILLADVPPSPEVKADILISLRDEIPSFVGQFPLYVDIVGSDDADKAQGRKRYRYFVDHGYQIQYHKLGAHK